jgi:hypothetical protein
MGDTLRDVGQLTSCQGYNITYVPECVMNGMMLPLYFDFFNFCMSLGIPDKPLVYCLGRNDAAFCMRMASSILYGFAGQYKKTDATKGWTSMLIPELSPIPELNTYFPTPRDVIGVTSPADLWERLYGPPSDVCGPLRTGDPGHFSTVGTDIPMPKRDCIAEVGERCTCPTPNAYCWCNTAYDNWCPIDWYDACDGCDEGCQFLGGTPPAGNPAGDPDCQNPACGPGRDL